MVRLFYRQNSDIPRERREHFDVAGGVTNLFNVEYRSLFIT